MHLPEPGEALRRFVEAASNGRAIPRAVVAALIQEGHDLAALYRFHSVKG